MRKKEGWFILALIGIGLIIWALSRHKIERLAEAKPILQQYHNKEEWELIRDEKGKLAKIVIHRDAKVT